MCRGAVSGLRSVGVSKEVLQNEALKVLRGEQDKEGAGKAASGGARGGTTRGGGKEAEKEAGALEEFCVDLTAAAAEGKLDPVIGRSKEVERVMQILARRQKNNPILYVPKGGAASLGSSNVSRRVARCLPSAMF